MTIFLLATVSLAGLYLATVAFAALAVRFRERMRSDPYFRGQAEKALREFAAEGTIWGKTEVALFMLSRRSWLLAMAEVYRPPSPEPLVQIVAPSERLARAIARRRSMRAYRRLYAEARPTETR